MARYRKIDVRLWIDQRFRRLSRIPPCGQGLWIYLLTNPDTVSIPGLYRAGESAIAESLGWSVEALRQAFAELVSEGMVAADWNARVVWIPHAIKYNMPESPNVVLSWRSSWDEIPECPLKQQAWVSLNRHLKGFGIAFAKAFAEACPVPFAKGFPEGFPEGFQNLKGYGESGTGAGTRAGTRAGTGKTTPPHITPPEGGAACTMSERAPSQTQNPAEMDGFPTFWAAYPRKVAKIAAARAWRTLTPSKTLLQAILASLERHKASEQWSRPEFIPHAATWLRGRRWEDEIDVRDSADPRRIEEAWVGRPGGEVKL